MDDGTSQPRTCDVCGKPLRNTNISGVCQSTPECRKERNRRDPRKAPGPKEPARYCEVCGKPIQRNNITGLCSSGGTPECNRERENRERRAKGIPVRQRNTCDRPGCTRTKKRGGVCAMHWSRFERTGSYGPDGVIEIELTEVHAEETYNSWTVLEDGQGAVNKVRCRCVCGAERDVLISALTTGRSQSCGRKCEARRAANPYLLPGTYGQLEVLETGLRSKDLVRIHCNRCGRDADKQAFLIKRGISSTCGCGSGKFTHGLSRHPLYGIWNGMVDRCTNPKATGYEGWGGRGIKVCDRWLDPAAFFEDIERVLGARPEGFSLDRINVDGDYEITNVRWADRKTQAGNRRSVTGLTRQRDALLAEVERLNQALASAPRKRERPAGRMEDPLF